MTPALPAMRLKTRWFKADGKGAAEQASAMAFIVFRVARRMLDRMRGASFDIDVGPPYFAFLREVLAFEVAVTDRIAFARLSPEDRAEFTVALVRHVARTLEDSEREWLGPPAEGAPGHAESFIDLVNELNGHYAEFDADPGADAAAGFTPGFSFLRYLGTRLEPVLPEKDRRWVLDQVMATEAPEAVATMQRTMRELFDPAPRRERRAAGISGE